MTYPPADLLKGLYALVAEHAGGALANDLAVLALRLQDDGRERGTG